MKKEEGSQILVPHRCVGRVFGNVPAVYYPLPNSANLGFISFPINNSVFTYKIRPLCLVWVSEPVSSNIRVVARDKTRVFAADDDGIDVLNFNGTKLKRLLHKKLKSKINFLIPIGDILVCIEESGFINVLDLTSGNVLVEVETPSNFTVSAAIHPETYYNKVTKSILIRLLFAFRSFWALPTDACELSTSIRQSWFTSFSRICCSIAKSRVWFSHPQKTSLHSAWKTVTFT